LGKKNAQKLFGKKGHPERTPKEKKKKTEGKKVAARGTSRKTACLLRKKGGVPGCGLPLEEKEAGGSKPSEGGG